MPIKRSLFLAMAVVGAGCASDGGGGAPDANPRYEWDSPSEAGSRGVPIKISYFRYDPTQDAKGQPGRWMHSYKYMLSQGWMIQKGPSPNEPFQRIWRKGAYVGENIHDARMKEMVDKLVEAGLNELRETSLQEIDYERLKRIEQVGDKDAAIRSRVITIEADNYRRTVASWDNADPVMGPKFREVERLVVIYVSGNTIQVTKETQSTMPRSRN